MFQRRGEGVGVRIGRIRARVVVWLFATRGGRFYAMQRESSSSLTREEYNVL